MVHPDVIVCHDIIALIAAVKLKREFGCPILYDAHEYWPEADLLATRWEGALIARIEAKYIRQADRVITVTPQLAQALEKLYGLNHVLSIPNAEPWNSVLDDPPEREPHSPVRFLIQGRVSPGRGIDRFLNAWQAARPHNAVLILRAPDNEFLAELKQRYARAIDEGIIVIAPAVKERDLIAEAANADVGVITYSGPSLNHLYCCPNKLSQYMQAGLAIFHHRDAEYVGDVVRQCNGGLAFDPSDPGEFGRRVSQMTDREFLRQCRKNAYCHARDVFNWSVQSPPYAKAMRDLMPVRSNAT